MYLRLKWVNDSWALLYNWRRANFIFCFPIFRIMAFAILRSKKTNHRRASWKWMCLPMESGLMQHATSTQWNRIITCACKCSTWPRFQHSDLKFHWYRTHYKWHLGELMKKHKLDSVDVMNNLECMCELKRNNVNVVLNKENYQSPSEDGDTCVLRALVRSKLPYEEFLQ